MELHILEKTAHKLDFELLGEGHTFCNVLRAELWRGKPVDVAGYAIEHSLVSQPHFVVTAPTGSPVTLLMDATERLQKMVAQLKEKFKKL